MKNKIDLYARISVAIVLAFLTSQLLVEEVFLAQSPALRPDIADRVVETSLAFINIDNYKSFIAGKGFFPKDQNSPSAIRKNLAKIPYRATPIQGVYAKQTENATETKVVVSEVKWLEVPYQKKDGSTIILKIPEGTTPPSPGLF